MVDEEQKKIVVDVIRTTIPKFFEYFTEYFKKNNPLPEKCRINEDQYCLTKMVNLLIPYRDKQITVAVSILVQTSDFIISLEGDGSDE